MKIDYDLFYNSRDGRRSRYNRAVVYDFLNPRSGWREIFENRADTSTAEDNQ
jgi:hypothetical protein